MLPSQIYFIFFFKILSTYICNAGEINCLNYRDPNCFGRTVNCAQDGQDCVVTCGSSGGSNEACKGATINCAPGVGCYVHCSTYQSCQNIIINGGAATNLAVHSANTSQEVLSGAQINCDNVAECDVTCTAKYQQCQNSVIHAQDAGQLMLRCEGGDQYTYHCRGLDIFCPKTRENCWIFSPNVLSGVDIYSKFGFDGVQLCGDETSNYQSIGTMHCLPTYGTSCTMDPFYANACQSWTVCDAGNKNAETMCNALGPTITTDPTTANPTTANPTTANPTTANPTTANPTTANPTTASPTTANPTTASPTTTNPTTASPITANPTTASPTTAEPTSVSTEMRSTESAESAEAQSTSNTQLTVDLLSADGDGMRVVGGAAETSPILHSAGFVTIIIIILLGLMCCIVILIAVIYVKVFGKKDAVNARGDSMGEQIDLHVHGIDDEQRQFKQQSDASPVSRASVDDLEHEVWTNNELNVYQTGKSVEGKSLQLDNDRYQAAADDDYIEVYEGNTNVTGAAFATYQIEMAPLGTPGTKGISAALPEHSFTLNSGTTDEYETDDNFDLYGPGDANNKTRGGDDDDAN